MRSMTVPDRIIAVGGGGIELAKTTVEQEWFKKAVLTPRTGGRETLSVQLIDTAASEKAELAEWRQTQNRELAELGEELEDPEAGQLGEIEIEQTLVTENMHLTEAIDLTGPSVVRDTIRHHGIDEDNWWIDQDDVNETLDFSDGVYRRRGLAKATLYKAMAEDYGVASDLDMPSPGRVALCVGLGGGTGAGMAIDIARELHRNSPTSDVTLFGVLPSPREEEEHRVGANAYAVLSELEYLQAHSNLDLFDDVVLLPIDATGYEGKGGDTVATSTQLEEFDTAFAHVLMAYYNTDQEDAFDGTPSCGPFTVAVPQVLQYNVGAIDEAAEAIDDALDALSTQFQVSVEMHERLREFLNSHIELSEDAYELTKDDRTILERRLEWLADFAEKDLFTELEFVSTMEFREHLEQARADDDDITEVIKSLSYFVDGLADNGEFVNPTDKRLAEVLELGVEALREQWKVVEQVRALDDAAARQALETLVDPDQARERDVSMSHKQMDTKVENAQERVEQLEDKRATLEEKLKDERARQEQEIQRRVEDWRSSVQIELDALRSGAEIDVESKVDALSKALSEFAGQVSSANTVERVNTVDEGNVREAVDNLLHVLDKVGHQQQVPDWVDEVETSLSRLKDAREASLQADPDLGPIAERVPWQTDAEERAAEAEQRLSELKAQLHRDDVFQIREDGSTGFSVDVTLQTTAIKEVADRRLKQARDRVIEELVARVNGPLADLRENEVRRTLKEGDISAVATLAEEAIEESFDDPDELTAELDSVEEELSELTRRKERYEALSELFEEFRSKSLLGDYDASRSSRNSAMDAYETASVGVGTDEAFTYIKQVQPEEPLQHASEAGLSDSSLLDDTSERRRLARQIDSLAANTLDYEYNGLEERRLSTRTQRYRDMKVNVGFVSPVADQLGEELQVKDKFADAFGLRGDASDFASWRLPGGNPWDIGMAVFIDGVFLDNLRNVEEYRKSYQARKEVADHGIHLHHALGLEEGWFVRRRKLLNVRNDDLEVYVDTDTLETLRAECVEKRRFGDTDSATTNSVRSNKREAGDD